MSLLTTEPSEHGWRRRQACLLRTPPFRATARMPPPLHLMSCDAAAPKACSAQRRPAALPIAVMDGSTTFEGAPSNAVLPSESKSTPAVPGIRASELRQRSLLPLTALVAAERLRLQLPAQHRCRDAEPEGSSQHGGRRREGRAASRHLPGHRCSGGAPSAETRADLQSARAPAAVLE